MVKLSKIACVFAITAILSACGNKEGEKTVETPQPTPDKMTEIQARVASFAPVLIEADLSHLTERERQLVAKLAEAGKICDDIFWKQSAHDAITVRDSLSKLTTPEAKTMLDLVNIYYGPYDKMHNYERFVGNGPEVRPQVGGFYPNDMTKDEFEQYITAHPDMKSAFESQYTVIVRDEAGSLKAVPYHEYYKEDVEKLAKLLDESVALCDNPSLKKYLTLRATAIRTDEYFDSDWAWMDLKDNNIDVVIGPIENYEDAIFNYKSAHEAVVMLKDVEATKELDMYKKNISKIQNNLPWDKKYHVPVQEGGTVLQVVNVAYFGGDCQKGTKTIAAALPNDPNVYEVKGGKKSMYKNMMEAKFDKIVKPIGEVLLAEELRADIDKKCLVSFVTLHEVSHNLGRGFVINNKDLTVRKALKEKYSPIEELKADILSMHGHKTLLDLKIIDENTARKTVVTYIAGLFRSMRFGAEAAHGVGNFIQFRYLLEQGAIIKNEKGLYTYNKDIFFDKVSDLAKMVLEIQAEGDYKKAAELVAKYGDTTPEIRDEFKKVTHIPSDLNARYKY